jgi:hypothetical protein
MKRARQINFDKQGDVYVRVLCQVGTSYLTTKI